jgi:hypothetical protein
VIAAVAAIVLPLFFTAPQSINPVTRYIARRGNAEQAWAPANVYGSPALTPTSPNPPGAADTVWVSVSVDPASAFGAAHGGQLIEIAAVTALEDSGAWSNPVALAAGCRDTLFTDGRTFQRPVSGVVRFVRGGGDDALEVGPVICQETWQEMHRDVICRLYGYVGLAGQRVPCGLVP